jgi:hypothetical protein
MLSNSVWDREKGKKYRSPAFSVGSGKVTYEFRNRRSSKIFQNKIGNINFLSTPIVETRDGVIDSAYGERSVDGYKYKSVSHSHILPTLLDSNSTVLGHGFPVKGGYENCTMIGTTCSEGTDVKCEVGKCRIGTLSRVSGEKWRYDSVTVSGLYYFVFGRESVELQSITKGIYKLPAGAGEISVDKVASISSTVYLPPNTYTSESFIRRAILRSYGNLEVRAITDSVDDFVRSIIGQNFLEVKAEPEIKDRLLGYLKGEVDPVWYEFIEKEIDTIWLDRFLINNREFLISCYNSLSTLYSRCVQVARSRVRHARVSEDADISRPVYNRLPGVEGAYNREGEDTAAKWLTSGTDDLLSGSKLSIDRFYRNTLNPDTCYPLNLDWLAQHFGFIGGLWNIEWPSDVKRKILKNAHVNMLEEDSLWTRDQEADTLRSIDKSFIEQLSADQSTGEVTMTHRYISKGYDSDTELTSLSQFNSLKVDVSQWPGLLPSRGSLISLLFMFWVLNIKAPSPEEMVYNTDDGTFRVKSGLRANESTAPVNLPLITDVLRVGSDSDAEVGNFPNQLIADISTSQDEESANTIVVRMPFYYNRNGRTWDTTVSVLENYVPCTSLKRVQYAYSAADLLVADDILFEPNG